MALTLPAGAEKRRVVDAMFDRIAPRYDRLNALMSLGAHAWWKRATVAALGLAPGAHIVDLACGTGDLAALAEAHGLCAIGVDRSMGMLAQARRRRAARTLLRADGTSLPLRSGSADGVVCGFALRNVVAIPPLLTEVARVLRPGGPLAILEVDQPGNAVVRRAHGVYFSWLVPLLGALLSEREAYSYLPASTAYLPGDAELRSALEHAGFTHVHKRSFMLGAAQLLVAERGPAC
jgi:demethylmenaquinone methyltransferase/2-methoxy-6-polyprenyl-1,4-benzoquinol methylase